MKKNYCLFLLLLVATSLSVCAQTGSKFPALRAFSNKKAAGMMKVSPNADKEKGLVMYATTLSDYFNQERGWYTSGLMSLEMPLKLRHGLREHIHTLTV